jgi:hypothetical protein
MWKGEGKYASNKQKFNFFVIVEHTKQKQQQKAREIFNVKKY